MLFSNSSFFAPVTLLVSSGSTLLVIGSNDKGFTNKDVGELCNCVYPLVCHWLHHVIRPTLLQIISHLNLLQLEEQSLIDTIPTWKVTSTCILMLDKVQNLYAKIQAYHHQINYSQIAGV